jgi:cell fate regulator YaaT (PSP1 superfamily)
MSDFDPVSMKMAKEQSLFLNPLKFSGLCGKLMCCLKYEYANYKDAKARLPSMGMIVQTPRGQGKVVELNVIGETVGVELEGETVVRYPASELVYEKPCPAGATKPCDACPAAPASQAQEAPETDEPTGEEEKTEG